MEVLTPFQLATEFTNFFVLAGRSKYHQLDASLTKIDTKKKKSKTPKYVETATSALVTGAGHATGIATGYSEFVVAGRVLAKPVGLGAGVFCKKQLEDRHKAKWSRPFLDGIHALIHNVDSSKVYTSLIDLFVQGGAELSVLFEPQLVKLGANFPSTRRPNYESIANDAVHRTLIHWLDSLPEEAELANRLVYGVLYGASKPLVVKGIPHLTKVGVNLSNTEWNSASLLSTTGLHHDPDYYRKTCLDGSGQYGFRRPTFVELRDVAQIGKYFTKLEIFPEEAASYCVNVRNQLEIVEALKAVFLSMDFFHNGQLKYSAPRSGPSYNQTPFGPRRVQLPGGERLTRGVYAPRARDVQRLEEYYSKRKVLDQKIIVVYGMGGIGKSELCRIFIKNLNAKTRHPALTTWLQCENFDKLAKSLAEYNPARCELKDPKKYYEIRLFVTAIAVDLKPQTSSSDWIVVFDNVPQEFDGFSEIVKEFLIQGAFVIITCRQVYDPAFFHLQITCLCPQDATKLVKDLFKDFTIEIKEEELNTMSHLLGNHPHALRQAVAYIKRSEKKSIHDFCKNYHQIKQIMLSHPTSKLDSYQETIPTIVANTLKIINEDKGILRELLKILCVLGPGGVRSKLLNSLFCKIQSNPANVEVATNAVIRALKDLSLVELGVGDVIHMNRVIQDVIKFDFQWEACQTVKALLALDLSESQKDEVRCIHWIWLELGQYSSKKNLSEIIVKNCEKLVTLHDRMTVHCMAEEMDSFEEMVLGKRISVEGTFDYFERHREFKAKFNANVISGTSQGLPNSK